MHGSNSDINWLAEIMAIEDLREIKNVFYGELRLLFLSSSGTQWLQLYSLEVVGAETWLTPHFQQSRYHQYHQVCLQFALTLESNRII